MHLSEGILSTPIVATTTVGALALTGIMVKRLPYEKIPLVAMMSSAFFVASSFHIPLAGASVHLVLNGVLGAILGSYSVVAIALGLLLQFAFFAHGGLTSLGANILIFSLPALMVSWMIQRKNMLLLSLSGFVGIAGSAFLLSFLLFLCGKEFIQAAQIIFLSHIPVMIAEGIITIVLFRQIQRIKPELLIHV